jgi:hypothetical protein
MLKINIKNRISMHQSKLDFSVVHHRNGGKLVATANNKLNTSAKQQFAHTYYLLSTKIDCCLAVSSIVNRSKLINGDMVHKKPNFQFKGRPLSLNPNFDISILTITITITRIFLSLFKAIHVVLHISYTE